MTKIILALVLASGSSAFAAGECKYKGKVVDLYSREKDSFDGVVECERELSEGRQQIEKHTFVKGREIEESIDGPNRKEINRFYEGSPNGWRHGEQLEYYPGTSKLKSRERYVKMHQVGLQEKFYESGKIREKKFYVQEAPDRGGSQVSSIGYLENGDLQYITCAKERANTIDPKICGFEGKSELKLKGSEGEERSRIVFLKGERVEYEEPATRSRGSSVHRGTIQSENLGTLKREKKSDGEKHTLTYQSGQIKRVSFYDSKSYMTGEDTEYFESGKIARKTVFDKGEIEKSECWWENGKPKTKIERDGKTVRATFTWDTGVVHSSGKYTIPDDYYRNANQRLSDMAIQCPMDADEFSPEGKFEVKRRDGTNEFITEYKAGQPVGWSQIFDEKGALRSEELRSSGTARSPGSVIGRKTYQDGKLLKEEKFNSDGSIQE